MSDRRTNHAEAQRFKKGKKGKKRKMNNEKKWQLELNQD